MSVCPVCTEPIDVKGRVLHRCAPKPGLPPPPRPADTGFRPPPQGSRAPLFVIIVLITVAAVSIGVIVLAGGGEEGAAPPITANATGTAVADTASATPTAPLPSSPAVGSAPATAAPTTPAPPPPPVVPLTEIPVEVTGCPGTTTTGTVPAVFLDALQALGDLYNCRFAGRWMFAVWVSSSSGVQEGGLFNIDQPVALGTWLPLLLQTPSGCIYDLVLDPATAISLSEGLPPGPCPPS